MHFLFYCLNLRVFACRSHQHMLRYKTHDQGAPVMATLDAPPVMPKQSLSMHVLRFLTPVCSKNNYITRKAGSHSRGPLVPILVLEQPNFALAMLAQRSRSSPEMSRVGREERSKKSTCMQAD